MVWSGLDGGNPTVPVPPANPEPRHGMLDVDTVPSEVGKSGYKVRWLVVPVCISIHERPDA